MPTCAFPPSPSSPSTSSKAASRMKITSWSSITHLYSDKSNKIIIMVYDPSTKPTPSHPSPIFTLQHPSILQKSKNKLSSSKLPSSETISESLTYLPTGVKCRATSEAKNQPTISDNSSINKSHQGTFQRLPTEFQKIADLSFF